MTTNIRPRAEHVGEYFPAAPGLGIARHVELLNNKNTEGGLSHAKRQEQPSKLAFLVGNVKFAVRNTLCSLRYSDIVSTAQKTL